MFFLKKISILLHNVESEYSIEIGKARQRHVKMKKRVTF